jgi:predicted ATPase
MFFSANNVITGENVSHHHHHGEAGINILHSAVALEALYDSADSFPQPRCHPKTRTKMLRDLCNWSTQDNSDRPILWLHGPAGAGKSAIMQTLCRKLQDAGCLGGAFFFKRGHPTRGNAKMLFATLGDFP